MTNLFLGRVPFRRALFEQTAAVDRIERNLPGTLIGFESEPVVTLGLRGGDHDLPAGAARLSALGVDLVRVDRGGQATLHNPGQLVIFPVATIGAGGTKAWVRHLIACTRDVAADLGQTLAWREDAPGLYDEAGAKVAAIGLRIRRGVSTHGLAINLTNDLTQFGLIRACGRTDQPVARLRTTRTPSEVFARWAERFTLAKIDGDR